MLVRPAGDDDLEAIRAIENRAIVETAANFHAAPLDAAHVRAQFVADRATYPWFVAVEDDAVVGFARGGGHKPRWAYRYTVETGVYIAPGRQRRGVGRALYERLIPTLRAQGFHTALGVIALPNPGSVALHERLGFRHVATIHEAGRKFDTWHDVGTWELFLSAPGAAPGQIRPPAEVLGAG